jgi:hypothetical protein
MTSDIGTFETCRRTLKRPLSVSQVRAMDRTAQLRGKCQSACKSHGSTCICHGTRQDPSSRRCCSANCTGPAAVNTWSPLEPRPATPRRRPWQKYRKPAGVISFVVPPSETATPPPNATADREKRTAQSQSLIDLQPVRDRFGSRRVFPPRPHRPDDFNSSR